MTDIQDVKSLKAGDTIRIQSLIKEDRWYQKFQDREIPLAKEDVTIKQVIIDNEKRTVDYAVLDVLPKSGGKSYFVVGFNRDNVIQFDKK